MYYNDFNYKNKANIKYLVKNIIKMYKTHVNFVRGKN